MIISYISLNSSENGWVFKYYICSLSYKNHTCSFLPLSDFPYEHKLTLYIHNHDTFLRCQVKSTESFTQPSEWVWYESRTQDVQLDGGSHRKEVKLLHLERWMGFHGVNYVSTVTEFRKMTAFIRTCDIWKKKNFKKKSFFRTSRYWINTANLDKVHTISQTELENAFEEGSFNYRIFSGTWTSTKRV